MTFIGTLRPFQEEAVDRIWDQGWLLVAYQMGLGKTVVTICAVEEAIETRRAQHSLVVVPASLKYQWGAAIEQFTGDDNYIIIDGTPKEREKQYERARKLKPHYTILNYEKVRDEWPQVSRLVGDSTIRVADEATVFKGLTSKISKRMKRLEVDIALTGQPIENRPEDLFSIMEGVNAEVLGRWDIFDRTFLVRDGYGRIKRVKNLPLLWELMEDAMVRKTRHDPEVAPFMPQVEETVIPVELDRATAKVYRTIVHELQDDLAEALSAGGFDLFAHYHGGAEDAASLRGQIMAKLTVLRMLCDHPDLVRISAQLYNDTDTMGSEYAYDVVRQRGLLDTVKATPKMRVFVEECGFNLEESPNTKIVVFSTFKPTLRFLRDEFLERFNTRSVIFDGDMSAKQKDVAKREFMTDPYCRVFLSSDAGGYGVDLPNANYLKNYDLPWSAGKLEQRNARIIRLSSEFDKVHVENYVIKGSIEDRQYRMLQEKMAIASAMVDQQGDMKRGALTLGLESLNAFLKETSV